MPPIRYFPPLPIHAKTRQTPIPPLKQPDTRLGRVLVAAGPRSLRTKHYAQIQKVLSRYFGRRHQSIVEVNPTRAVTRRVSEAKMGKGKGDIIDFAARIPAGQPMVQLPQILPFNEFEVPHVQKCLAHLANILPNKCIIRNQFNHFKENSLKTMQQLKQKKERHESFLAYKRKLHNV